MADERQLRRYAAAVPIRVVLAVALTGFLGVTDASAFLASRGETPKSGLILIQDTADPAAGQSTDGDAPSAGQPSGDVPEAPFSELNEALAAARARLEELSKAAAVAAAAGQVHQELRTVRQENRRLAAQVAALRAARDQLQNERASVDARLAELTRAAEEATAEAKRVEEELAAVRWQNAQLNTSLSRLQAAREQIESEARKTEETLTTKVKSLTQAAEQSAAEIARLRQDLAGARQQAEAAAGARSEIEQQLAELQERLRVAERDGARLREQMTTADAELAAATQERDQAVARMGELEDMAERLRSELAAAQAEAKELARNNQELEAEVVALRSAATSAAEAARQNLLAVEERIRELNAALAGIEPAAGGPASDVAPDRGPPATDAAPTNAPRSDRGPAVMQPIAPARAAPPPPERAAPTPPAATGEIALAAAPAAEVDADLERIKSAEEKTGSLDQRLAELTAGLPLESRLQVQGLLADLDARVDPRGLLMTVPGAQLFEINSDTIEPAAHDTLAKVAELIDLYKDRKVLIVGHTDSIGEASYNKGLSQRRADLVKHFFIDNFDIDAARLSTMGLGEDRPIGSNATVAGRQANRRVEVLILN